jgi:hypothetical protein
VDGLLLVSPINDKLDKTVANIQAPRKSIVIRLT